MNARRALRAALAASAVIGAVVSTDLLSPTSSPSAMPLIHRTSAAPAGALPAGTRLVVTEAGVRFSFSVPRSGWESLKSIPTKQSPKGPISINKSLVGPQGAEAILFWTSFPKGDYADPCSPLLSPGIGSSAADLAAAVSTARGTKLVKGPVDVTVGGRPAKYVVLTVRKDVGCDPGFFYSWKAVIGGAFWTTSVGDTIRVWIVSVGGKRIFIEAETASSGLEKEIQQIVKSIRFD